MTFCLQPFTGQDWSIGKTGTVMETCRDSTVGWIMMWIFTDIFYYPSSYLITYLTIGPFMKLSKCRIFSRASWFIRNSLPRAYAGYKACWLENNSSAAWSLTSVLRQSRRSSSRYNLAASFLSRNLSTWRDICSASWSMKWANRRHNCSAALMWRVCLVGKPNSNIHMS